MALLRGASAPDPDDVRPLKPCLLRRNHSRDQHGVAASCLEELRSKACEILAIDESLAPVTLVLAEDGTIVDDDDYFLCLPSNTKFVALACNEKWTYNNSDGGTAWVSQESFDADETDSGVGVKWRNVARQLKEDLSSVIRLSEEDLQALIDIPCSELARELCQSCATVQGLQNTLQQVLDQREEARQSKQLLELYLRALEKEGDILSNQEESKAALSEDLDAVDTGISKEMASDVALTSRILTTLREKPSPELSLSSQDLELVSKEDPKALAVALNWDIKKAETVQQACNTELTLRLQQMQSLRSLRNFSARKNPLPGEQQSPKRAKQDPE
ncbi:DNA fragmentation factor subunit alpha isoform X2 [Cricetulus griseus]|uniref:DNA fragmentation factor subunit alpha n=1 Tax=Cricetulus griseus TaxID=10029 RepID=A0A8C2MJP3_CRIGR|nr:DNA fragmentation factor subunit alpha isoform X2 [Cricetulus griseus]ERE81950.1 DNA fragmentation factor subunit alpha-like protein [Cricetulus griseus]